MNPLMCENVGGSRGGESDDVDIAFSVDVWGSIWVKWSVVYV